MLAPTLETLGALPAFAGLRLSVRSLFSNRLVSSQIIVKLLLVETPNALSDGRFRVLDAPPPVRKRWQHRPSLSGFVRLLCLTNDVSIGPSQDRSGRTSDMGEGQAREESGQK
jgi:hypothetical protein